MFRAENGVLLAGLLGVVALGCGTYDGGSADSVGTGGSSDAGGLAGSGGDTDKADGAGGSGGEDSTDAAILDNGTDGTVDRPRDGGGVEFEGKKIDLLFVIDNSGSMKEEQEKLRVEIPRMIRILISGDLNPDDGVTTAVDFPPVSDLHVAVVSTNMGLPGVQLSPDPMDRCQGYGDNGKFLHSANAAIGLDHTCPGSTSEGEYPLFLSFSGDQDIDAFANDIQCLTVLGTSGCPFEMQLEAPLKALWPANPDNLSEEQAGMHITFFANTIGHGDQLHFEFLRGTEYHPTQSDQPSLLAIILLTDEEDCSAGARGSLDFLEHPDTAPAEIADQPRDLRCFYDTDNKYPVSRYVEALQALRPGYEQLVVFAAIVGIPSDISEETFDQDGDPGLSLLERNAYYDTILGHPLMQERIRADGQRLEPSCTVVNPAYNPDNPSGVEEFITSAMPARRIVQVVRGFGENGVIRSICQQDFASAVDAIIGTIARRLNAQ